MSPLLSLSYLQLAGTKVEDARSLLESAVHFSESTFKAVWDGSLQEQPAKLQGGQRDCVECRGVCLHLLQRACCDGAAACKRSPQSCKLGVAFTAATTAGRA